MKPDLFLLPGLTCDAAVWRHQSAALAPVANPIVPDWGSLNRLADMARLALSQSPQDRIWVAGHSMGARVALEMWRLAPERIAGLALLDTGAHPRADGEAGDKEERGRMALLGIAQRQGMRAMGSQWARGMVHESRRDSPVFDEILAMQERSSPAQFEAQIQALLNRPDARPLLSTITCPVWLLCGEDDAWSPPAQHQAMADLIPHAQLTLVAECGHMSPMEQPEAVSQWLLDWWHATT
ncbi:MAG: hypothetical protein RL357_40 [Pseudomonadota bacterium]